MENNTENKQVANQSHEKTAKQLKKQKVRQTIVSLIGIALILWGVVKVVLLFIDYSSNETSNDAQVEQYISPVNLRASGYIKKICFLFADGAFEYWRTEYMLYRNLRHGNITVIQRTF